MINIASYAKPKQVSGSGGGTVQTFRPITSSGGGSIGMVSIWGNEFDGTQDVEGNLTINNHDLFINGGNAEMVSTTWTDSYFKFLETAAEPSITIDDEGNEIVNNGHYSRLRAQNTVLSLHSTNEPGFSVDQNKFVVTYPVDDRNVMAGIFFGEDYYGIQEDANVTRIRKYDVNTGLGSITQLSTDTIQKKTEDGNPIGVYPEVSFKDTIYTTCIQNSGEIITKDLTVTGAAHFFELVIDKLRSVGGQVILTAANAKVDHVEFRDTYYRLYSKATDEDGNAVDQMFVINDQIKCQSFNRKQLKVGEPNYNVSNQYWWRLCTEAGTEETDKFDGVMTLYNYVDVSDTDKDPSSLAPTTGDEIVLLGSRNSDKNRSNAIILSAYKSVDMSVEAPSIVQYKGITTYELEPYKYQVIASNGNYFRGSFTIEANGETVEDHIKDWLNGKITYTHIAYANALDGTDFTKSNDAKDYNFIGFCINSNESDEDLVFTDYEWSRLRGLDGKAEVTYTWIRYADDMNGTNFSDNPVKTDGTLRYYIGFAYNKNTATESEDWTEYTWVKIDAKDGAPGKDGGFTWIKYADSVEENGFPTEMYDTPTSATEYIGIATGQEDEVEATNIYVYKWSKFKGDKGVPGESLYTWVKYSKNANGYPMSDSPWINGERAEYIGFAYNKTTPNEGTDVGQYQWFLWKGTDGTDGIDGDSGYMWIKYADDITYTGYPTTMYDIPTEDTQYIGIATGKNEETESTSVRDYRWARIKGDQGIPGESIKITGIIYKYAVFKDNTTRPEAVAEADWAYTEIPTEILVLDDWLYTRISTTYNDGTSTYSYGVSRIGGDGKAGDSAFVHFAYAQDVTFDDNDIATAVTGFSVTWFEGASYIGILSDTVKEDSTNWEDYKWARLRGEPGPSTFTSYVYKRYDGTMPSYMALKDQGSYTEPTPSGNYGWSDTIPEGTSTVWMQSRIFTSDGKAPQQDTWTAPVKMLDSADMDVCFSKSTTQPSAPAYHGNQGDSSYSVWHDTPVEGDLWMAVSVRTGGEWGPWKVVKIKGEDGIGVYIVSTSVKYILTTSTTKPATSASWLNYVPTLSKGKYLWTWTHVEYSDGKTTDTYGCSYIGTDGTNGTDGEDGKDGTNGTDGKDGVETIVYKLIPLAEEAQIEHSSRNLGVHLRYQMATISGTSTTISRPGTSISANSYIQFKVVKNGTEYSGATLSYTGNNTDVYYQSANYQSNWYNVSASNRITAFVVSLYVKINGSYQMVDRRYVPVTLARDASFIIDDELNEIRSSVTDTEDYVDEKVSLLSTQITQNANSIKSEAKRIDIVEGKITDHTTAIKQNADEIELVASQNDKALADLKVSVNNITARVEDVSLQITDQNITLGGDTIVDGSLTLSDGESALVLSGTSGTTYITQQEVKDPQFAEISLRISGSTTSNTSTFESNRCNIGYVKTGTKITLQNIEAMFSYIGQSGSPYVTISTMYVLLYRGSSLEASTTISMSRNSGSGYRFRSSGSISFTTKYNNNYYIVYKPVLSSNSENLALKCWGNVKYPAGAFNMIGYDGMSLANGYGDAVYITPNITRIQNQQYNHGGDITFCVNDVGITATGFVHNCKHEYSGSNNVFSPDAKYIFETDVVTFSGSDNITVNLPVPTTHLSGRRLKFRHLGGKNIIFKCTSSKLYAGDGGTATSVTRNGLVEIDYFYANSSWNGILIGEFN